MACLFYYKHALFYLLENTKGALIDVNVYLVIIIIFNNKRHFGGLTVVLLRAGIDKRVKSHLSSLPLLSK